MLDDPYQAVPDFSEYEGPSRFRNYTYRFPELNGQVLRSAEGYLQRGQRSFSSIPTTSVGEHPNRIKYPAFFNIQLEWDAFTPFNFTDGTSVSIVSLLISMRTSTQKSNPGDILAAELCAFTFCAQRRNVSLTLNQVSSTVLETVSAMKYEWGEGLSLIGDDLKKTSTALADGLNAAKWVTNLRFLLSTFEGNLAEEPDTLSAPTATSNLIGAFNASSNISMTMNNIATAMTNYFRDSSDKTVVGQAGQTELFIHVTWPWIALPVFLVLAGTVFLILAMWETKRVGASIWKTSELALLFHGSEESYADLSALDRSSEMENVAAGIKARMTRRADGKWVLRREKP